jgi:hypothetical protein
VSESGHFTASAEAAVNLWEQWRAAARTRVYRDQIPSLLELQTVCRESGCSFPELDGFAGVLDLPPAFLLCGGDSGFASEIASLFGLTTPFLDVPDEALLWWMQAGPEERTVFRHGQTEHDIYRKSLEELLLQETSPTELFDIDETIPAEARWRVIWVPHPRHFHTHDGRLREIEALLAQRAALIVQDDSPDTLRATLEDIGQKLWEVARDNVSTDDERRVLFSELMTLLEDRPEDIELRASAAWRWLSVRLLDQIEKRKQAFKQALNRYEIYVATTRHLLSQYQKNWTGGLRALLDKYMQGRLTNPALASFLDAQKPGPQPDTFVAAISLPSLQSRVDEYLTDQMAALVGGLSGLSVKLELRRISIGDVKTNWSLRPVGARLENLLKEKRIFPAETGKRGGLVGNLTGKKQAILDERRGQVARAVRTSLQFIEHEFIEWSTTLVNQLEANVMIQLTAALANKGLPDPDTLQTAITGLDRLEKAIRTRRESVHSPEAVAAEWLKRVAECRLIPLYQAS